MPIASTIAPWKLPREQPAHGGRPVVGRAALVEQQALAEQRAEHAARELGEHVDHASIAEIRLITPRPASPPG